MRATQFGKTPFNEGRRDTKTRFDTANPYTSGSVAHRNYELGRDFGIANARGIKFKPTSGHPI